MIPISKDSSKFLVGVKEACIKNGPKIVSICLLDGGMRIALVDFKLEWSSRPTIGWLLRVHRGRIRNLRIAHGISKTIFQVVRLR